MKEYTSGGLFRLTIIAAMVLTVLASLIQPVPASAAPDQGDGYWTDSFTDSTGISDSTSITVSGGDVRLSGTSIELLRPAGSGSETSITNQQPTSGAHWDKVDESTADNNTTFVYQSGLLESDIWRRDLYVIQDHSQGSGAIASVTIHYRVKRYQNNRNGFALASIRTYGTTYDGATNQIGPYDSWVDYTEVWTTNPYTGQAWTWTEIDSLESGISLQNSYSWFASSRVACTQVYVSVQYRPPGSLNSVSITLANLQSWGTFNATDNTTCLPYRKPISITGTGTALTDYQISVPVTYVAGKMNSDFSDLRFKDSSGTVLSYWIESYVASTSAQVWVKVPSIAASGTTTIYMYYGSAAATSASSGSDTFIFFDDFSGDLSKWSKEKNGASINIVSGYLECGGGTTASPYGHTVLGSSASYSSFTNGIIEGKVYLATDGIAEVGYRGNYGTNTGYKSRMDARAGQGLGHLMPPYSGWDFIPSGGGPSGTAIGAGTWRTFSITVNGSSLGISCAGQALNGTDTSYAGPGEISLQNHHGTYSRFDDIRVRKYASTTPALSTGSEQSGSYCGFNNLNTVTSITYKILNAADDSVLCTITAAQAAAGYNIASCVGSTSSIKLRAELSTSNPSQTPILYDWRITWTSVIPVTIDVTAPGNILSWNLLPGITNINTGTLTVTVSPSGTNWYVTAQDIDTANTNGFMTLREGSSYNTSVKLTYAMNVLGISEVTLPGGGTIASGSGNYSGAITFKQYVTWDDDPGTYQIVVTFTATTVD